MYTGKIGVVNEETSLGVVRFAHHYEMPLLINIATDKLKEYTSKDNCIERLYLAENLGIPPPLRVEFLRRIRDHFMAISKTKV